MYLHFTEIQLVDMENRLCSRPLLSDFLWFEVSSFFTLWREEMSLVIKNAERELGM